jgi:hypothetical protein
MAAFLPPSDLTDSEVVRRILAGDPALFEILMRRHNQRLYRALRSLNPADPVRALTPEHPHRHHSTAIRLRR